MSSKMAVQWRRGSGWKPLLPWATDRPQSAFRILPVGGLEAPAYKKSPLQISSGFAQAPQSIHLDLFRESAGHSSAWTRAKVAGHTRERMETLAFFSGKGVSARDPGADGEAEGTI